MESSENVVLFFENLSDQLLGNGNPKYDKKTLKDLFDSSIEMLAKTDVELTTVLKDDQCRYAKKFIKLFRRREKRRNEDLKKAVTEIEEKRESKSLPFNLYKTEKIKNKLIEKQCSDLHIIYSTYLYERIKHTTDCDSILKLLSHCRNEKKRSFDRNVKQQPVWIDDLQKLCSVAIGKIEPTVLQCVMQIFNRYLAAEVEACLSDTSTQSEDGLNAMKSLTEDFLTYLSRKHSSIEEFQTKPKYKDLLAATMSLYVDVILMIFRRKSEAEKTTEGKRLCGIIFYVFRHNPEFVLDVIIQASPDRSNDAPLLIPICRKAFSKPAGMIDHDIYTKYMIAICRYKPIFDDDVFFELITDARELPAPVNYVDWLLEKDASIGLLIPRKKKHFKELRVTQFLLNNLTEDLLDRFLDILTDKDSTVVDLNRQDAVATETTNVMETSLTVAEQSSFFFDRENGQEATETSLFIDTETSEHSGNELWTTASEMFQAEEENGTKSAEEEEDLMEIDGNDEDTNTGESDMERKEEEEELKDVRRRRKMKVENKEIEMKGSAERNEAMSRVRDLSRDKNDGNEKKNVSSSSSAIVKEKNDDLEKITGVENEKNGMEENEVVVVSEESEEEETRTEMINAVLKRLENDDDSDVDLFKEFSKTGEEEISDESQTEVKKKSDVGRRRCKVSRGQAVEGESGNMKRGPTQYETDVNVETNEREKDSCCREEVEKEDLTDADVFTSLKEIRKEKGMTPTFEKKFKETKPEEESKNSVSSQKLQKVGDNKNEMNVSPQKILCSARSVSIPKKSPSPAGKASTSKSSKNSSPKSLTSSEFDKSRTRDAYDLPNDASSSKFDDNVVMISDHPAKLQLFPDTEEDGVVSDSVEIEKTPSKQAIRGLEGSPQKSHLLPDLTKFLKPSEKDDLAKSAEKMGRRSMSPDSAKSPKKDLNEKHKTIEKPEVEKSSPQRTVETPKKMETNNKSISDSSSLFTHLKKGKESPSKVTPLDDVNDIEDDSTIVIVGDLQIEIVAVDSPQKQHNSLSFRSRQTGSSEKKKRTEKEEISSETNPCSTQKKHVFGDEIPPNRRRSERLLKKTDLPDLKGMSTPEKRKRRTSTTSESRSKKRRS